jgi:DNA repair protein RadC
MLDQLAALIGGKKAKALLATVSEHRLMSAPLSALVEAGLSDKQARLVKAAVSLGLAVLHSNAPKALTSPEAVAAYLGDKALDWVESIWFVTVDAGLNPIGCHRISCASSPDGCPLLDHSPLIRACLLDGSKGGFMAHNHPSGRPAPSTSDIAVTREIQRAMRLMKLELFDHIIVAGANWASALRPDEMGSFTEMRIAV